MADHSVMGFCLCTDRAERKLLILGEACRSSFLNRGVIEEFDEMLFVSRQELHNRIVELDAVRKLNFLFSPTFTLGSTRAE
jgi:hypothetical protein